VKGKLTLAIVKPDAVAAGHTGKIIAHLEAEGFRLRRNSTPCTVSGRSSGRWSRS